jgi:hypothetical protein
VARVKIQKGSWLVLLPLGVLSGYLIADAIRSAPQRAQSAPLGTDAEATVEIWRAEVVSPLGEVLSIRLAPLHGEAQHAVYDGERLRARFGLDEGFAWRLELVLGDGTGIEPGYIPSITDDDGVALRCIENARGGPTRERHTGQLTDPVATLFAAGTTDSGYSRIYLLWGRAPSGAAQLVLSGKAGETGKNAKVLASYPLKMEALSCNELPRSLVRLDPIALIPSNEATNGE